MRITKFACLLTLLSLTCSGSALALDTFMISPRAMGMGGANIVSVRDASAQYYNPAAFACFNRTKDGERLENDNNNLGAKKWGIDLGVSAGYRLHDEFSTYIDDLANIDLNTLEAGISTESDLQDLIKLVNGLAGIDQPGTGITADLTAGLGIRVSHFGFGARTYAQASSRVLELDSQNLGFSVPVATLNTEINSITQTGNDNSVLLLSAAQQAELLAAGFDAAAIQQLDFAARSNGVDPADVQAVVDILEGVATSSGSTATLNDNTTTVDLTGFAYGEIPISYGVALSEHIAVGGNLKIMQGRVYGNQILVFDNGSGDLLAETDEHFKETTTFGIDLGLLARYDNFGFGLIGRNLNSPEFDGFSENVLLSNGSTKTIQAASVRIDPQFAAGAAFMPLETLTFEVNIDLTRNETAFPGYETQNLSAGIEWDAFKVLALRAGVYKNLAENDIDLVYTAGFGLNLWAARLDIAATFAADTFEYDGEDYPQEARVAAMLSIDF